jgi:hypothetical protein
MCQIDYENGLPECQLSFGPGVPEDDVPEGGGPEDHASVRASGHQKVIQAKFEVAVHKSGESDSLEDPAELLDRNPLVVLLALNLVAEQPFSAKH